MWLFKTAWVSLVKSGLNGGLCRLSGKSSASRISSTFLITFALVRGVKQGGAAHLASAG